MATKREKREAGLAKREEFMAAERARGLEALQKAQHAREMSRLEAEQAVSEINRRWLTILATHLIKTGR